MPDYRIVLTKYNVLMKKISTKLKKLEKKVNWINEIRPFESRMIYLHYIYRSAEVSCYFMHLTTTFRNIKYIIIFKGSTFSLYAP